MSLERILLLHEWVFRILHLQYSLWRKEIPVACHGVGWACSEIPAWVNDVRSQAENFSLAPADPCCGLTQACFGEYRYDKNPKPRTGNGRLVPRRHKAEGWWCALGTQFNFRLYDVVWVCAAALSKGAEAAEQKKGRGWAAWVGEGEGRGGLGWEEGPRDLCELVGGRLSNSIHMCLTLCCENLASTKAVSRILVCSQNPSKAWSTSYCWTYSPASNKTKPNKKNLPNWGWAYFAVVVLLRGLLPLASICF